MRHDAKPEPRRCGRWCLALLLLSFTWHFLTTNVVAQAGVLKTDEAHRIQTRLALASAYFQAKMWLFAMEEVDQALRVSPTIPEALALKALIFQMQNRNDLAGLYFAKASLQAPQNAQIAHNFGVFFCETGQFKLAFDQFQTAHVHSHGLDKDKTSWVWGQCLLKSGEFEGANAHMTEALNRQPEFILMALELAALKIQLKRYSEAEKILDFLNDSPSVSAQSLWLGMQLAERQNQEDKKNQWGKMLGQRFSNSTQWRATQVQGPHD